MSKVQWLEREDQVPFTCLPGWVWDGTKCVPPQATITCPPGLTWDGTQCVAARARLTRREPPFYQPPTFRGLHGVGVGDLPACLAGCESKFGMSAGANLDFGKLAECTSNCVSASQAPPGGPGGQVPVPVPPPAQEEPPAPAPTPEPSPAPTPAPSPAPAPAPAPTTPVKAEEDKGLPWGWIALGGLALAGVVWAVSRGAREVGAGISSNPSEPRPKFKIYLERVRLDSGGYDSRGQYWGVGEPLYRYSDDSGAIDGYVRAASRAEAKEKVRYQSAGMDVSFYRAA